MKLSSLAQTGPAVRLPNFVRKLLAENGNPGAGRLVIRYGFALLCIVSALFLTLALQQIEIGRPPLLLLNAAIVIAAWFGGAGPGAMAVLLSLMGGLYFYAIDFRSLDHRVNYVLVLLLLMFTLCAWAGRMLGSWRRNSELALNLKAQQLQQAYDALHAENAERRRTEQALQEARNELARAARLTAMGELAATIAHEVNQPLAAISNSAGACARWLDADPPNLSEARMLASWIVRDSERAAAVISRVRAIVSNAMPERAPLGLNRVIHDVLETLEYDLRKHRIAVTLSLDPRLPRILADRVQIQQVFLNLFLNAIEAMTTSDERRLAVRARSAGSTIIVEIEDSGLGFDGLGETLFQPFYTTKEFGMGLGLSICRSIVEGHSGTLSAVAGVRGACFRMTLPRGT